MGERKGECFNMFEDIISEENIKRYAEEETQKAILFLVRRAFYMFSSYINGATHLFEQRFKVALNVEVQHTRIENGFQLYLKVYLDPETISRIREAVYKYVKEHGIDVNIRLKILKSIIKREFKTNTGGVNALLHDIHPSSTEGADEIGRVRKKVWREEGRSTDEGVDEGDIRGDKVEGDEK